MILLSFSITRDPKRGTPESLRKSFDAVLRQATQHQRRLRSLFSTISGSFQGSFKGSCEGSFKGSFKGTHDFGDGNLRL